MRMWNDGNCPTSENRLFAVLPVRFNELIFLKSTRDDARRDALVLPPRATCNALSPIRVPPSSYPPAPPHAATVAPNPVSPCHAACGCWYVCVSVYMYASSPSPGEPIKSTASSRGDRVAAACWTPGGRVSYHAAQVEQQHCHQAARTSSWRRRRWWWRCCCCCCWGCLRLAGETLRAVAAAARAERTWRSLQGPPRGRIRSPRPWVWAARRRAPRKRLQARWRRGSAAGGASSPRRVGCHTPAADGAPRRAAAPTVGGAPGSRAGGCRARADRDR